MIDARNLNEGLAGVLADQPVYLRADVKLEPLFCGWLAWSHLLAPVQSALNVAFRYLPLLQSFVTNHKVHVAATQDRRLFGGPFVHLGAADVPRVRQLIATTKKRLERLLKLAEDIRSFDTALQESARGFSVNELYARVPQSLAGMVELMYDINNHPRIHFIEELLYAEYGADLGKGVQEIALSVEPEAERRFYMSTPRLPSPDMLIVSAEYADPAVDVLTSMRLEPASLAELQRRLGIEGLADRYGHLFTATPPERHEPHHAGEGVRIRYFGHACVLLQSAKTTILIDPMFACEPGSTASRSACNRLTMMDLPDTIDYVVLTHCHQDHFSVEMLLQIRSRIRKVVVPLNNRGCIADPSMKLILARLGLRDVLTLGYFDTVTFADGRLVSIPFPGEHSDLEVYSKQSVLVELDGRRMLFLVDSDGWEPGLYRRLATQILSNPEDRIHALFLGMECFGAPLSWLYGPLLTTPLNRRDDESRRLSGANFERAARIVQQFKCDRVYVYAMGQEPWLRYIMGLEYGPNSIQLKESDALVNHCRAQGMVSERLYGSRDMFL